MITETHLVRAFAPDGLIKTQTEIATTRQMEDRAEPRTSFVRGVVVALAVAIPVWIWFILSIIR